MEIILAVVVVAAVIFFGALISIGNERQRKALDAMREQIILWAMQDLRLKREKLAHQVHVEDPLGWLNKIAAGVCGRDLKLKVVEAFEEPRALVCVSEAEGTRLLFTPLSHTELRRMNHNRRTRLNEYANGNPLVALPRGIETHELSVLNAGMLFDLELPLAWKGLTGQALADAERLWMYFNE